MTDSDPDFWYLLDWDYGIIVFPTKAEAEAVEADQYNPGVDQLLFPGWYGKGFSGWIGRQQEAEE
jgi:hypothetical protein